jgi:16S rRNA (adenine1518-N6/adenine1519-N6)-dimethyltransferase
MTNKNFSHRARKRFGQNFLTDTSIIEKIVKAISAKQSDKIIEIGPGQGALTELLLTSDAELHAIEIDRDLAAFLREKYANISHFHLHEEDVLKVDFSSLLSAEQPARIIGNLPYNISTPLIFHLLKYLAGVKDMLFMLQLEVVERMAAVPGSKSYGRLSIMVQYYCQVEKLFNVPSSAFSPAPKVESAIVKLTPLKQTANELESPEQLTNLLRQAFAQRRKTLRNNLSSLISAEELENLGINPGLRPENLSLDDYVKICKHLH